ncbi:protein of unknown function DUF500 [Geosmithia morbida]|uniref:Ysc84 actin-binding domain-containing protein n=1 Tax=Geosmithia morbida TaxID=1094350 RepID=A0A9P4Z1B8_9HYPO|nr:protein of unknown function DUF500 [Geosmithia morbida]KAF4126765.1 protein of unknown function DUF500 [Geosmithia morbida]
MQRVSSLLPSWDRRASSSSATTSSTTGGGGGFFAWSKRASSASILTKSYPDTNSLKSNRNSTRSLQGPIQTRIHREAFWPATLDLECDKAARIIKSFCGKTPSPPPPPLSLDRSTVQSAHRADFPPSFFRFWPLPTADGFLAPIDDDEPTTSIPDDEADVDDADIQQQKPPKTPVKISKKIPKRIIQNAAGIAVFTCMRSGLWMTGSGGSGILIARKSDGTWSPPSGIMLHTPTLSFIMGVDVYDCVLVISSLSALESITRSTVTLGEDVGLMAGPLAALDASRAGLVDDDFSFRDLDNTVLTYMKSRGHAQSVNMHGCILTERANENERFYEAPVSQMDILSGNVARDVEETRPLAEVIKLAEGRSDFDPTAVAKIAIEPAPGDANIASPVSAPQSPRGPFGYPQVDDPDPFGILALEMAGMEIREAGTTYRPVSSQLDFQPANGNRPLSSTTALSRRHYSANRQSGDTFLSRSNRESYMSTRTVKSQMTDAHTQTDTGASTDTPGTSPGPGESEDGHAFQVTSPGLVADIKERDEDDDVSSADEVDYTTVDTTPIKHLSQPPRDSSAENLASRAAAVEGGKDDDSKLPLPTDADQISKASSNYDGDGSDGSGNEEEEEEEEEEPVVFEVAEVQPARTQAVASRMIQARGNVVTIPKRIPPPLPTRNPARGSVASRSELSSGGDGSSLRGPYSPLYQEFLASDLSGNEDVVADGAEKGKPATTTTRQSAAAADGFVSPEEPRSPAEPTTPLPPAGQSLDDDDQQDTPLVLDIRRVTTDAAAADEVSPETPLAKVAEAKHAASAADKAEQKQEDADAGVGAADVDVKTEGKDSDLPTADGSSTADDVAASIPGGFVVTPADDEDGKQGDDSRVSIDTGATGATGNRSSLDESAAYTTPSTSEHHFPSGSEEGDDKVKTGAAEDDKSTATPVAA